jgi:hypothetical protein
MYADIAAAAPGAHGISPKNGSGFALEATEKLNACDRSIEKNKSLSKCMALEAAEKR